MSVRAQAAGELREAILRIDGACAALAEDEGLSDAGRDELAALLVIIDRCRRRLREAWGARVVREARERAGS